MEYNSISSNKFTKQISSLTYSYYTSKLNEIIRNAQKQCLNIVDNNHEYTYCTGNTFKLWSEIDLGEFICDITLNTIQNTPVHFFSDTNSIRVTIVSHIKYKENNKRCFSISLFEDINDNNNCYLSIELIDKEISESVLSKGLPDFLEDLVVDATDNFTAPSNIVSKNIFIGRLILIITQDIYGVVKEISPCDGGFIVVELCKPVPKSLYKYKNRQADEKDREILLDFKKYEKLWVCC